jgi:hypothetical protein
MNSQNIEPQLGAKSFSCPHCNAIAHQDWYRLFLQPENATDVVVLTPESITTANMLLHSDRDALSEIDQFVERLKKHELTFEYQNHPQSVKVKMANLHVSNCHNCNGFGIWVGGRLVFPFRVADRPDLVAEDFEEAAVILDKSPRGAAALIHLCVQTLIPLEERGKHLDNEIAALIGKGLKVEIQEAMGALRVLANNGVHSGNIDLKENRATATRIFALLKMIVERRRLKESD